MPARAHALFIESIMWEKLSEWYFRTIFAFVAKVRDAQNLPPVVSRCMAGDSERVRLHNQRLVANEWAKTTNSGPFVVALAGHACRVFDACVANADRPSIERLDTRTL